MRLDSLTKNKQVQELMRGFADQIHSPEQMENMALYFRDKPFLPLMDAELRVAYLKKLNNLSFRLVAGGTMGNALRDMAFSDDLKKQPDQYVRFLLEDAVDKVYGRSVGAEETKDLEALLSPVSEASFRKFYHRVVFLRYETLCKTLRAMQFPASACDDGIVAYGYIDTQAGLSFKGLCCANLAGNRVNLSPCSADTSATIRYSSVEGASYIDLLETNTDLYYFNPIIEMSRLYDADPQIEAMRSIEFLDYSRHPQYPDDVRVILYDEQLPQEIVWVCCQSMDREKGLLFGRLLNEPNNSFGVHCGDTLAFRTIQDEDGHELCLHIKAYE